MRRHNDILFTVTFALWLLTAASAFGAPPRDAEPGGTTGEDVEGLLEYLAAGDVSASEVNELTELFRKVEQPGRPAEELQADLLTLYTKIWELRGFDVEKGQRYIRGTTQMAAMALQAGGRYRIAGPEPGKPFRELAVASRGSGPTPMLLLADVGMDAAQQYRTFMDRNGGRYTMHAVSFPGSGGSGLLPWSDTWAPSRRGWLDATEDAVAGLVDEKGLDDFVVVGTAAGGYLAARLAIRMPEKVRAVVLSGALLRTTQRSLQDPEKPADPEERKALADMAWPMRLLPLPPVPPREELEVLLESNQHPLFRDYMANGVRDSELSRPWSLRVLLDQGFDPAMEYNNEMQSTDLTEGLKGLTVPMLAMVSVHDDGSPGQGFSWGVNQWQELRLLAPEIPLSVVTYQDTRAYVSEDRPEVFEQAVADFLAGRPVEGLEGRGRGERQSPHACLMQVVGTTEIEVCYGRPAVAEREVWGQLVPWQRVWRTGANEATTIEVSTNVALGGRCLKAGRYSLFTLPEEEQDWTVMVNRIADQWGAFQYDPRFDVLRFSAKTEKAGHQERLAIRIDGLEGSSSRMTVHWEKLALAFDVEGQGAEGKPAACGGS